MKKFSLYSLLMVFATMISTNAYAYDLEVDDLYYNLDMDNYTATVTYGDNWYAGDIVVPSQINYKTAKFDVVKIGRSAFSSCEGLTSVALPEGIIEIEDWAFRNSENLVEVIIPSTVKTMGEYVFGNCINLEKAILPEEITVIGLGLFSNCRKLSEIQIPSSVINIYSDAYNKCVSVKKISIPNSVDYIGTGTFSKLTLDELIIEDGEGEIKTQWSFSFNNTSAKTLYIGRQIDLGNSFESEKVETLILGPNLKKWYNSYTGSGVTKVISKIADPSQLPPTFDPMTYLDVELVVPVGTLDLYKADPNWNKFLSISEETSSGINNASADINAQGAQRFNIGGLRTSATSKGISIIRENGKVKKVIK